MTQDQRPRITSGISYGSIISTAAIVLSALGILVTISRFTATVEADIRAVRNETAMMIATERQHREALERRVDREQTEIERRVDAGLAEVKALLAGIALRVDRLLEAQRTNGGAR